MKHQALFSSKDKNKNIKVSSAAILLGALRINIIINKSSNNPINNEPLNRKKMSYGRTITLNHHAQKNLHKLT